MTLQLLPLGDHAVLVEGLPAEHLGAWADRWRAHDAVEEAVPGAATVMLRFAPDADRPTPGELTAITDPTATVTAPADVVLAVRFDGPDLSDVAARVGVSVDDLVAQLLAAPLRSAFCGFAAGFAYLTGLPAELQLPRRDTPRTRVPAGSFALAGGYAAVYPTASPGGWHLLGTCSTTVWDPDRDPPSVLVPGTVVRIEAVP